MTHCRNVFSELFNFERYVAQTQLIDLNDYWLHLFLFSLQLGAQPTRNRYLITRGKSRYRDAHTHKCCLSWKQTLVEVLSIRVHLCNRRMEEHLRQRPWFHKINHYHHTVWFVLELLFYQLSTYFYLVQGRLASSEALSSLVGAAEESSHQLLPLRQGMHLKAVSESSPTS